MQCPHLSSSSIKLKSALFNKRQALPNEWECNVCKTRKSPWLCLHCGIISCGRYINGHAKSHYNDSGHFLCVDCNSYAPFCYVCDDYVINDTRSRHIHQLRSKLLAGNEHENNNGTSTTKTRRTAVTTKQEMSSKRTSKSGDIQNQNDANSNRSRSRSKTNASRTSLTRDNGMVSKKKVKVKAGLTSSSQSIKSGTKMRRCEGVTMNGLRNLGNTCFMNAVLQSLSNIQQFSGYFKKLPSLENVKVSNGQNFKSYPSFYGTLGSTYTSRSTTSMICNYSSSSSASSSVKDKDSNNKDNTNLSSISSSNSSSSIYSNSNNHHNNLNNGSNNLSGGSNGNNSCKDVSASVDNNKKVNDTLLAEELRKTLLMLWGGQSTSSSTSSSASKAISPESLFAVIWKVVPRYRGYQQQDAHEFLRYILDRLHSELLSILPYHPQVGHRNYFSNSSTLNPTQKFFATFEKSTVVTKIFGGLLQNEVTCLVCGNESKKHDPFLDLSLDLPESINDCSSRSTDSNSNDSNTNSGSASSGPGLDRCHLFDCLSSFIRLEELEDTELYHCSFCKKKQKSTKRFWIRRLPNVLCLHIKRFRWNNYFRTKLDTFVEYPIRGLDMSKFVLSNQHETRRSATGGTLYDLAAVIVHHGSGAGSGHYTAYAMAHGGCWHHFNDSNVTVCEEETVAKASAYILFYIRRQLNLTSFNL